MRFTLLSIVYIDAKTDYNEEFLVRFAMGIHSDAPPPPPNIL
jgi:hypothetical protein